MGLLECASGSSLWRGYDYFKENRIVSLEKIGENIYSAKVAGSSSDPYSVELHINHPRKSKCNCSHANGKKIICKHIVATYFTVLPKEAERLYNEEMEYEKEEEKRQKVLVNKVIIYVNKMKKADLSQALLDVLFNGPKWQYNRFIRDHSLDDDLY